MYQNKLQLQTIDIAEHLLTFGDIKTNKINSKHTELSQCLLCPPCWDCGNSSYRRQWFRCETSSVFKMQIESAKLTWQAILFCNIWNDSAPLRLVNRNRST